MASAYAAKAAPAARASARSASSRTNSDGLDRRLAVGCRPGRAFLAEQRVGEAEDGGAVQFAVLDVDSRRAVLEHDERHGLVEPPVPAVAVQQLVARLLRVHRREVLKAQAEQRCFDGVQRFGVPRGQQGRPARRPLGPCLGGEVPDGGRWVVDDVAAGQDRPQPGRQLGRIVRSAVRCQHVHPERCVPPEHDDVPRVRRTRPCLAVRRARGVQHLARDTRRGEEELVLHHGLRLPAHDHRRDQFVVQLELVVDRGRDQFGRAFDLAERGPLEQEEEVGVQRDPVPAAEVAVRPERVQPAEHACRLVVRLKCFLQFVGRAVRSQEVRDGRLGSREFVRGQQRRAPLQEPPAAVLQRGQRHPGQALVVAERAGGPLRSAHGHPRSPKAFRADVSPVATPRGRDT